MMSTNALNVSLDDVKYKSSNVQNGNIMIALSTVEQCIMDLDQKGYTILTVSISGARPVIWIQNSTKCGELNGSVAVSRSTPQGRELLMAASHMSCQVQWRVRGH